MNPPLEKVQQLVRDHVLVVNEQLETRILDNTLDRADWKFIEHALMSKALIEIWMLVNMAKPELHELGFKILEYQKDGGQMTGLDVLTELNESYLQALAAIEDKITEYGLFQQMPKGATYET